MKALIFSLLPLLIALQSCNNDDDNSQNPIDQLPPATQTGENTFGCLINGEPFVVTNSNNLTAIYQQGQLQFGVNTTQEIVEYSYNFNIIDPLQENTNYIIGQNSYNVGYTSIIENIICIYDFDDTIEGSIYFSKIDNINYIISGVFEFSTVTEDCEVVIITNGRFDLQYIP